MKCILVMIVFLMINMAILGAGESEPYSYNLSDKIVGGKLSVANDSEFAKRCFFIKPSLGGETDMISVWEGPETRNIKGISLSGVRIYSSFAERGSLYVIWEENGRFYLALLDRDVNIVSVTEIMNLQRDFVEKGIKWFSGNTGDEIFILIAGNLYICKRKGEEIKLSYITSKVKVVTVFSERRDFHYAYISDMGAMSEVYFVDYSGRGELGARVQLPAEVGLLEVGEMLVVISTNQFAKSSWLHFVGVSLGVVNKKLIGSNGNLIDIFTHKGSKTVGYLRDYEKDYSLVLEKVIKGETVEFRTVNLPRELIEPQKVEYIDGVIYILFRNGLVTYGMDEGILSIDYERFGEYFETAPDIMVIEDYLLFSTVSTSLIFKRSEHKLWWLNRFLSNTGKIIFPLILILMLLFYYKRYRGQKRLLRAIMELRTSGAVFVLDKRTRLRSANDTGKEMLKITENVPMKRLFQYYCEPERTAGLKELVEKALRFHKEYTGREGFTQKVDIIEDNAVKEWYFSSVLLSGLTGKLKGFVLTGYDITEQLERKRLTNWAQLAHDMQTNLSTIRLNAEQLECSGSEFNLGRRGRILHQVGLLIHRIRDIVTVGRSAAVDLERVNAGELCREARSEFDESMFPYVNFKLELRDVELYCDRAKMVRVLRNVIENAVRSLKEKNGSITISNWGDNRYHFFSVKDTGVGMDEEQLKKMMTPYFTTSEGGAGIGTMIIQNVIEQHGGSLKINSEPGAGTEVIISIPIVKIDN